MQLLLENSVLTCQNDFICLLISLGSTTRLFDLLSFLIHGYWFLLLFITYSYLLIDDERKKNLIYLLDMPFERKGHIITSYLLIYSFIIFRYARSIFIQLSGQDLLPISSNIIYKHAISMYSTA